MKRLHIVGCPRSGTTLLMELVTTCFESSGFCDHETSIFEPPDITEGELYISKQPNDIKQILHIFPRDPDLNIIYMGRDPRAVITSKHRESPQQYFCNYRVWKECDVAATLYARESRFLSLRYEDLVANPDAVQVAIAGHFPFLRQLHRFSEYTDHANPSAQSARAMHGTREVDQQSLEKWHGHLPRIAEQLARHPEMKEDLVRLGYEPDHQWLAMLDGVTAQRFPCRYPERRPVFKELEKSVRVYLKSRRYLQANGG